VLYSHCTPTCTHTILYSQVKKHLGFDDSGSPQQGSQSNGSNGSNGHNSGLTDIAMGGGGGGGGGGAMMASTENLDLMQGPFQPGSTPIGMLLIDCRYAIQTVLMVHAYRL
jgi:hypothetical protein